MHDIISIDPFEYGKFCRKFKDGEFGTQRLGQAFVNHFRLDRMSEKSFEVALWELDGEEAKAAILKNVLFQ